MISKFFSTILGVTMALTILTAPVLAERVKTDGKTGKSPIKVTKLDFLDSGYGQPGPSSEIRVSVDVKNTSAKDDIKNVVISLQLKNLAGDVIKQWKKTVPVMKKGASVSFKPDGIYYNYSFNNLQGAVAIEHDKPEDKKTKKKDKKK